MGHRLTQRIHTCALCGVTPDDGEYMWNMGGVVWCKKCVEKEEEEEEEVKNV